jgi:Glycosyltransferase family 87
MGGSRLTPWQRCLLVGCILLLLGFAVPVEMRSALMSRRMGDLDCFLRAAWAVRSGADLYSVTDDNGFHYNYPPLLAVLATPLADPPHKDVSLAATRTVGLVGTLDGGGPLLASSAQAADETPLVPDAPPTVPYLPFAASVAVVYLFNLGCLCFAVHVLAGVLDAQAPAGSQRWWALRVWPVLACLVPIGHTLMRSQSNLLVLGLLAAALAAVVRGRGFRAGLWLAGAACLKIFPAFLLLFPLWRRDGRCLAGSVAGLVLGLVLIPLAVLGPQRTWHCYARLGSVLVLPGLGAGGDDSRAEELTNVTATDSQSLLNALHNAVYPDRATRPDKVSTGVRLTSYLVGGLLTLFTLAAAGRRVSRDPVSVTLFLGLLVLDMLLLCPVCHLHYFSLALPLVAALLVARWQRPGAGLAPGVGLTGLLVLFAVANLLPHLGVLRQGGLATSAALLLWAIGFVVLVRRGRAHAAIPSAVEVRVAA